jgi:hypothetical protein
MWWLILFISAFSSIFPPMLGKLIWRYLVTSWLFCVSGFVIGMIFAFFHISGKIPFLKQPLHTAVMLFGSGLTVCLNISAVIPSSPGISYCPCLLSLSWSFYFKFAVVWCVWRLGCFVSDLFMMIVVFKLGWSILAWVWGFLLCPLLVSRRDSGVLISIFFFFFLLPICIPHSRVGVSC